MGLDQKSWLRQWRPDGSQVMSDSPGKLLRENPGFILCCFSYAQPWKVRKTPTMVVCTYVSFFQADFFRFHGSFHISYLQIFHIISCLFVTPTPKRKNKLHPQKTSSSSQTSRDKPEDQNHPPFARSYKKLENSSGTPSPSKTTRWPLAAPKLPEIQHRAFDILTFHGMTRRIANNSHHFSTIACVAGGWCRLGCYRGCWWDAFASSCNHFGRLWNLSGEPQPSE